MIAMAVTSQILRSSMKMGIRINSKRLPAVEVRPAEGSQSSARHTDSPRTTRSMGDPGRPTIIGDRLIALVKNGESVATVNADQAFRRRKMSTPVSPTPSNRSVETASGTPVACVLNSMS